MNAATGALITLLLLLAMGAWYYIYIVKVEEARSMCPRDNNKIFEGGSCKCDHTAGYYPLVLTEALMYDDQQQRHFTKAGVDVSHVQCMKCSKTIQVSQGSRSMRVCDPEDLTKRKGRTAQYTHLTSGGGYSRTRATGGASAEVEDSHPSDQQQMAKSGIDFTHAIPDSEKIHETVRDTGAITSKIWGCFSTLSGVYNEYPAKRNDKFECRQCPEGSHTAFVRGGGKIYQTCSAVGPCKIKKIYDESDTYPTLYTHCAGQEGRDLVEGVDSESDGEMEPDDDLDTVSERDAEVIPDEDFGVDGEPDVDDGSDMEDEPDVDEDPDVDDDSDMDDEPDMDGEFGDVWEHTDPATGYKAPIPSFPKAPDLSGMDEWLKKRSEGDKSGIGDGEETSPTVVTVPDSSGITTLTPEAPRRL